MNAAPVSPDPKLLGLWNVKISPCNTTRTKWEIHVAAIDFDKANRLATQWIAQNLPTQVKRIDGIPCANCDEVCSVSRIGSGNKSVFPYVAAVTGMSGFVLFEPALKVNERIAMSRHGNNAIPLWEVTLEEHPYPLYVIATDFASAGDVAKKWLREVSFEDEMVEANLRQDLFEDGLELVSDQDVIDNGARQLLEQGDTGQSPFDDIFEIAVTSVQRLDSFVVMDEKIAAMNPRSSIPATGSRLQ